MPRIHKNHALLPYGNGCVQNNAWGYAGDDPPQSASTPPGDELGWQWDWPASAGHDASQVVAYPEIIHGKKPFLDHSTLETLPAPLAAIERIRIAYVTQTRARGRYNAAFELWLVDDAQARPEHVQAEVMVWVAKRGLSPAGDCVATVDTPYGKADLFEAAMQHWRYYAYVLRDEMPAGVIDLMIFVRELLARKKLDGSELIASIEFGNEIAFGKGRTAIEKYSLDIG